MEEIGYMMIQIFILLLLSEIFGKTMKKFGMPDIIGFVLAGILFVNLTVYTDLGNILQFDSRDVFDNETHFLPVMGQLGLVFLLFGIGLETRLSELMSVGRNAFVIALTGVVVPFVGGFAYYYLIDDDVSGAIMLGTAIFAMSAAVCVKLLQLMGITDSRLGRSIVGIAIFSDIICLILMAVSVALANPVSQDGVVLDIIAILVFVTLVFLFIAHTAKRKKHVIDMFEKANRTIDFGHRDLFTLAILLCMGFTASSYIVGLSGIVGAFLAGMYFAEFEKTSHIVEKFETLTGFLLPFFFITVGLRLRFDDMSFAALYIGLGLAVVAIATKYLGGYVGARICGVSRPVSKFTASCMVARGDIAVIVATLALSMGVFNTDIYAAVIIMAVVTQVLATPLMKRMFAGIDPKDPLLTDVPDD